MLRNRLALLLIKWARKLTTWGCTDDYLRLAQEEQGWWIEELFEDD